VKDGMDISLLCINKSNRKVFWSGANNPLWFLQDNTLQEIKANKQPIGKTDQPKPFTSHQIDYKDNTIFYLFTDGLADQFGGLKGKKFKYKQFEELLFSISDRPMQEQSDLISKKFEDWKGTLEQVDDICIIGIKL
jgi:serine phosphatase RsbU (regulator of sigma subunit)